MKSIITAILITVLLSVIMAPKPIERTAEAKSFKKESQTTQIAAPQAAETPKPEEIPTPVETPATEPVVIPKPLPSGSHEDWMTAAGIGTDDFGYVDYIISHESGWDPSATNASSGSHGLPQALPYSKTGCDWIDAVCQLQWANAYAIARYGGWANAYNYWLNNHYW